MLSQVVLSSHFELGKTATNKLIVTWQFVLIEAEIMLLKGEMVFNCDMLTSPILNFAFIMRAWHIITYPRLPLITSVH